MALAPGQAARAAAVGALSQVLRQRTPLDVALAPASSLPPRDAGFARAIAAETLRRFGQIESLIRGFVPKAPPPHKAGAVLEILYAGTCELLFLDVAPHAAVDGANRLAQADLKAVHFKPLINAVLRRVAREGAAVVSSQDQARLNAPDWLWQRWTESYGETETRRIAEAHLCQPPLDIVLKRPEQAVPLGEPLLDGVLRLTDPGHIEDLSGYAAGNWWVQDTAATLPVRLLGDVRGQTVIDLCAAPGGKTMQLAAAGANVIAVEREPERMARLRDNLARTQLSAALIEADVLDFRAQEPARFVLLDAPCSATGTIRRHPDLPWIKSASDITLCEMNASGLLDSAAGMVAAGGLLVFAVCSLEPEEGIEQVNAFLARNADFAREPVEPEQVHGLTELISPDGDLRTLPCHLAEKGGMDGFYAVRLRRTS